MELESADGSKIPIDSDSDTVIGRGLGLTTTDRTIARRHLSLRLLTPAGGEHDSVSRVSFQVIGKNPVLLHTATNVKQVYRQSEKGELLPGDRISLSLKHPSFFTVVKREGEKAAVDTAVLDAVERRERRTRERRKEKEQMEDLGDQADDDDDEVLDMELGSLDVSQIDPVKEFGFLVDGNEFDVYPKKKIRPAKSWNWFLEEEKRGDGDDEDDEEEETTSSKGMSRGKGRRRGKKRGGHYDDDEVWTGESEDEKELAVRAGGIKRSKYSMRSKDPKKPRKEALCGRGSSSRKDAKPRDNELEEEDEEDETLGGFIVSDEDVEDEEEEELDDEVEEEELDDEEEEEELEDEDED